MMTMTTTTMSSNPGVSVYIHTIQAYIQILDLDNTIIPSHKRLSSSTTRTRTYFVTVDPIMSTSQPGPYKSPVINPMIQVDPAHTGKTVRKAFFLESVLNLFTLPLIFAPQRVLSWIVLDPLVRINPATVLFARCFGGLVVGALTPALWLGLPQTKTAIESRRTVYLLLAGGEIALIPLLIDQAIKGGDVKAGAAISVKVALMAIAGLLPPLMWRMYVLLARPQMLGRYRNLKDERD